MGKVSFNEKHKEILDSFLLKVSHVKAGKMFGYPAYYVNKKLFACVYKDGVSLKVPEKLVTKLLQQKGIMPFEPMAGRKMREWVLISRKNSNDYLKDRGIFQESINFVLSLTK